MKIQEPTHNSELISLTFLITQNVIISNQHYVVLDLVTRLIKSINNRAIIYYKVVVKMSAK